MHRDLKPHNVFLTGDERVKVLDFGVALSLDSDPGPVTRFAGTPGYMAPEQRDGAAQDARVDVWAAALLVVECLIGRRVEDASGIAELDAPPTIREILADALAANPARRPRSAGELRLALSRAQQPASPALPRRARWPTVAAAVAGAAAATAITFLAMHETPHKPHPISSAELSGLWVTKYGQLTLRIDPDGTAYGVYDAGGGIVEGHYDGTKLVGWWCEGTQEPPDHAGIVEMHFVRGPYRKLMDGRWKFGSDEAKPWNNDFTGFSYEKVSPELEKRIAKHEACPR
jgi:hypothetical protein